MLLKVISLASTSIPKGTCFPFQDPATRVSVKGDGTTDVWVKEKRNKHAMLSIGSQITADLAFLLLFNEGGTIEGGLLKEVSRGWRSMPLRAVWESQVPRHIAHGVP